MKTHQQLLKAIKRRPGYTEEQLDEEAILLRAYGSGSEVLIDRNRDSLIADDIALGSDVAQENALPTSCCLSTASRHRYLPASRTDSYIALSVAACVHLRI